MSSPLPDADAEREVDLSGWRDALVRRWWIVAACAAAGIVVGALFSLSGGSMQEASVLIAPGQPFTQTGSPVQNYVSSVRAINEIATSATTLKQVSQKSGIPMSELRGHVRTETVTTGPGSAASRGTVLVRVIVTGHKPRKVEQAAEALGQVVQDDTTSPFVEQQLRTLRQRKESLTRRLGSIEQLIQTYQQTLDTGGLEGLDKLIIATQYDAAVARQGNINDSIFSNDERLALAENVEVAQVLTKFAVAEKTSARSRRNSILVGLLIGLVVGVIAAIVVDRRMLRTQPA